MNQNHEIIRQLKRQDQSVLAVLYDSYAPALYGVVLRIVQSEPIAQDVLQETFVKIWRNGPSFDPQKGRLFTWMLNIARNTAIDTIRSAHYRNKQKIQSIDQSVYNSASHSEQFNVNHIGLDKLVGNLDDKYREVIDLIYFKGYTQSEVVKALGIPLGTVKSRVRIALRELRKVFQNNTVSIITLLSICFLIWK